MAKKINTEKDKSYRQILKILKKQFQLELVQGIKIDLSKYSIIEKGSMLKIMSIWKLKEFNFEAYLLTLRKHYNIQVAGTFGESMVPREIRSEHGEIILKSELKLPELIIRPFLF